MRVLFSTTVYPLLSDFCAVCHSSGSAVKQQPFFAEGPDNDPNAWLTAYEAAKSKMDLDDPATTYPVTIDPSTSFTLVSSR